MKAIDFITKALHAFADEYNSVYVEEEEGAAEGTTSADRSSPTVSTSSRSSKTD